MLQESSTSVVAVDRSTSESEIAGLKHRTELTETARNNGVPDVTLICVNVHQPHVPRNLHRTGRRTHYILACQSKEKVISICIASIHETSLRPLRYSTHWEGIAQFYPHTLRFIRKWNDPYLPLPSQPQLVLIYQPQTDGRLSRPWCEVNPAGIQICNLTITSVALYHTATSTKSSKILKTRKLKLHTNIKLTRKA